MVQVFWDQYPLGSKLSRSLVAHQLSLFNLYVADFLQTSIMLIMSSSKSFWLFSMSSTAFFYKKALREPLDTFRSQPALSLAFITAYIPLLMLNLTICSLVFIILHAAILFCAALTAIVSVLFCIGAPSAFLVWLFLYRYPIFDVVYPRLRAWMLQHNARVYRLLPNRGVHADLCIRVVRLKPGLRSQDIECDLVAENLSDASFDALSYVWGISLVPYKIIVNGQPFYVTSNLYTALRYLRHPADERLLWIDALAINQADAAEKSLQVQQMRDIYRKASKVIIWLGQGSKATSAAFQLAQDIGSTSADLQKLHWEQAISKKSWRSIRQEWRRILDHQWWRRSWIIQEVVVGYCIVVQSGTHQISWDMLQNLFENRWFGGEPSFDANTMEFSQYIQNVRTEFASAERTTQTLFNLAFHFRHQSATLGSDKLFALQGLLPLETPIKLVPDYSESAEEVFIDFAVACIEERKDLVIIALAAGSEVYGVSWCRDWSAVNDGLTPVDWFSVYSPPHKDYSAAAGHPVSYTVDIPRRLLSVRGFTVDSVAKCTAAQRQIRDDGIRWHTVLQLWESSMGGPWSDASESKRSFNRTVTADCWPESSISWEARIDRHGPLDPKPENEDYRSCLDAACTNRTLFLTEGGRFGLGPSSVEKGDVVSVFLGSRVPFILRRCGKSDLEGPRAGLQFGDTQEYFKLVGEAYVDGVMYYEGDIQADILNGKVKIREYGLL